MISPLFITLYKSFAIMSNMESSFLHKYQTGWRASESKKYEMKRRVIADSTPASINVGLVRLGTHIRITWGAIHVKSS